MAAGPRRGATEERLRFRTPCAPTILVPQQNSRKHRAGTAGSLSRQRLRGYSAVKAWSSAQEAAGMGHWRPGSEQGRERRAQDPGHPRRSGQVPFISEASAAEESCSKDTALMALGEHLFRRVPALCFLWKRLNYSRKSFWVQAETKSPTRNKSKKQRQEMMADFFRDCIPQCSSSSIIHWTDYCCGPSFLLPGATQLCWESDAG
ncbi:uncharacterized protein [Chamaea fasciata]|uniref:uncharacterized protein isoform X2 n=1 Tax=Chamaea fasciata TaxID=190680 RepID=UPI00336A2418